MVITMRRQPDMMAAPGRKDIGFRRPAIAWPKSTRNGAKARVGKDVKGGNRERRGHELVSVQRADCDSVDGLGRGEYPSCGNLRRAGA